MKRYGVSIVWNTTRVLYRANNIFKVMGRPFGTKKIESPERLMELFEQYKNYIKANPFLVQDYVGKDGVEVFRTKEKPLTIDGFETWLFQNAFIGDLSHYFANTNGAYSDFLTICYAIRKECRNDQINGGMAGIYNPSITQRLNGLTEKSEIKQDVSISKMPEWLKAPIENNEV